MKVMLVPHADNLTSGESGIHTLCRKWVRHGASAGIEFVNSNATSFDVLAVHAGMSKEYGSNIPLCSHLHGIYWTGDYQAHYWEWKANRDVIDSIRHATTVTVPSAWVAFSLQRDMHLNPVVLPHGIDWQEWRHDYEHEDYVLWNKNRAGVDVCSPVAVGELARRFPEQRFLTTFAPDNPTPNIKATGLMPHLDMRRTIQKSAVYLSSVKETFGIGVLEAMASGVPVLGFRQGGILETIKHGVNGYLAEPGNYDDLAAGLEYCIKHRRVLGENGQEMVKRFTWQAVMEQLHGIYEQTIATYHQPADVAAIIPCYNYGSKLARAVNSVLAQTYPVKEIIVIDNNSSDNTKEVTTALASEHPQIRYVNESRQGVAHARNRGISEATTKYIVPIDADDEIKPTFVEACVNTLEADKSLGLAYTKLLWVNDETGQSAVSEWPGQYDYNGFLNRKNQVPTCNVFRRDVALRLGGYRQRYAPNGAGAEDAELWLRMGAHGYGGKLATDEALFIYHLGGNVSGNKQYKEPDWLAGHPWITDKLHPFASLASPVNRSHAVRQYDEPVVSVVIPCAPHHTQYLVDALDSLEAQSFRQWEAIVVCDGFAPPDDLQVAYPFVKWHESIKGGAGVARNAGAKVARGKFLLFLDADDWLRPQAIDKFLEAWNATEAIAYSDYAGRAYIDNAIETERLRQAGRLLSWNEKTKEAVILHHAFDYDCEEALRQPRIWRNGQLYIWCVVTSLVPKVWHDEIGGFDEQMESWEDWDYYLRLARAGKCFTRIAEPLLEYRFYTGQRRENGSGDNPGARQLRENLLQYLQVKYSGGKTMGCSGCGGKRVQSQMPQMASAMMTTNGGGNVTSADIVWVKVKTGLGERPRIGVTTKQNYGYKDANSPAFKMFRVDAQAQPGVYIIVPDPFAKPIVPEEVKLEVPEPVEFVSW